MTPSFTDLGVPPHLVDRLRAQGIESPFPIQQATIPDALAGRDVCGRAPTGSGKTLAFGLALTLRTGRARPRRPEALVLVPTRELAAQVQKELSGLSDDRGRRVIAVYGGTGYGPARQALARGVDTVVACPGRLEDLISQGAIDLSGVGTVVLDEADRMSDMGFLPAVRRILDLTADDRQVLLFSATLGKEIEALVDRYQTDPARHSVEPDGASSLDVTHLFWKVERDDRVEVTADLVQRHGQAIVFCRTKRGADRVARRLKGHGVDAVAIHGDRTQSQREKALAAFTRGRAHALVATDVAARGIHVEALGCVVHFDPPADHTDYLHRSGRTGRAGRTGTVVSLVTDDSKSAVGALQRSLGFEQGMTGPGDEAGAQRVVSRPRREPPTATQGVERTSTSRRHRSPTSHTRSPAPRSGQRRSTGPGATIGPKSATPKSPAVKGPAVKSPVAGGSGGNGPAKSRAAKTQGPRGSVGTVKFFNQDRGFGFVTRPDGGDLFVHHSNIEGGGPVLQVGQRVSFQIGRGRKGAEACRVRVV